MNESKKTFPALHIDYTVFFLGTDAEQEAAEAKETARAAELEKIIFSGDFIAAEYITERGQRRILHHSTRPGVVWQLSYIDPDGVPAMHENFISAGGDPYKVGSIGSREKLLSHFIHAGNNNPLSLRIITKGGKAT